MVSLNNNKKLWNKSRENGRELLKRFVLRVQTDELERTFAFSSKKVLCIAVARHYVQHIFNLCCVGWGAVDSYLSRKDMYESECSGLLQNLNSVLQYQFPCL